MPEFLSPQIKISSDRELIEMPASKTTTNILELNGAAAKNSNRRRVDTTPSGPLCECPSQGAISFEEAWALIVEAALLGVLTSRDNLIVHIAAELYVEFCGKGAANMDPAKLSRLVSVLASLGVTPADASRVSLPRALIATSSTIKPIGWIHIT